MKPLSKGLVRNRSAVQFELRSSSRHAATRRSSVGRFPRRRNGSVRHNLRFEASSLLCERFLQALIFALKFGSSEDRSLFAPPHTSLKCFRENLFSELTFGIGDSDVHCDRIAGGKGQRKCIIKDGFIALTCFCCQSNDDLPIRSHLGCQCVL